MKRCKNCNNVMNDEDLFCDKCGARFEADEGISTANTKNKKIPKWAIILTASVLGIVFLCIGGKLIYDSSKNTKSSVAKHEKTKSNKEKKPDKSNYALYLKEGNIWITDEKGKNASAVSQDLYNHYLEGLENQEEFYQNFNDLDNPMYEYLITLYNDQEIIVYPEKYTGDPGTVDLYWKSLKDNNAQGTMIDSGVEHYSLGKDDSILFYKTQDGFYMYDFENRVKLLDSGEGYGYVYDIEDDESHDIYCLIRDVDGPDFVFESNAVICMDEKRIVYPGNIMANSGEQCYDLMWKSLESGDGEVTQIDSGVSKHQLVSDKTKLIYAKEDGIYQYDFQNSEKIIDSPNVVEWIADAHGENVVYVEQINNMKHNICLRKKDGRTIILQKDCFDYSLHVQADWEFENIFFRTDFSLYSADGEGKVNKIADLENYADFVQVYDDGTAYYCTASSVMLSGLDLIEDDMLETDNNIKEPVEPVPPVAPDMPDNYEDGGGLMLEEDIAEKEQYEEKYNAYTKKLEKYNKDYTKYEEDCDIYSGVAERNRIREELDEQMFEYWDISYYYFDGKESHILGKDYTSIEDDLNYKNQFITVSSKIGAGITRFADDINIDKIKMSEVTSIEDVDLSSVEIELNNVNRAYYAICRGKVSKIAEDSIREDGTVLEPIWVAHDDLQWNESENALIYIEHISTDVAGDLKQISFEDEKNPEPVLLDTEVHEFHQEQGQLYCLKLSEDNRLNLYLNQELVLSDVSWQSREYMEEALYVIADWDWERGVGNLYRYKDKELEMIVADIHNFTVWPGEKIYYLKNYNMAQMQGELYLLEKGGEKLLDDNILDILSYPNLKVR